MIRIAKKLRPTLVLFENVPSIRDWYGDNRSVLERICNAFRKINYKPHVIRFNAAEVMVPQNRIRTFIVATIDGRPVPDPSYSCIDPLKEDSKQHKLPLTMPLI